MPLIPDEIPQQHFELIRDRIGLILFQEIENQWSNFGDEDLEAPLPNPQIGDTPESMIFYVDRIIPIDQSVYTKAAGEDDSDADRLANIKLQKILGKIAFILRHSYYKTLGFEPGFIGRTNVASIQIADQKENSLSANGCVMGRVTFEVTATEYVTPVAVRDMTGFFTSVKMFNSDKGYLFIDTY